MESIASGEKRSTQFRPRSKCARNRDGNLSLSRPAQHAAGADGRVTKCTALPQSRCSLTLLASSAASRTTTSSCKNDGNSETPDGTFTCTLNLFEYNTTRLKSNTLNYKYKLFFFFRQAIYTVVVVVASEIINSRSQQAPFHPEYL
jgi:hypothetical protein